MSACARRLRTRKSRQPATLRLTVERCPMPARPTSKTFRAGNHGLKPVSAVAQKINARHASLMTIAIKNGHQAKWYFPNRRISDVRERFPGITVGGVKRQPVGGKVQGPAQPSFIQKLPNAGRTRLPCESPGLQTQQTATKGEWRSKKAKTSRSMATHFQNKSQLQPSHQKPLAS